MRPIGDATGRQEPPVDKHKEDENKGKGKVRHGNNEKKEKARAKAKRGKSLMQEALLRDE